MARTADEPARLSNCDFREDRLYRLVRKAINRKAISVGREAEILGLPLSGMRELPASWLVG